MNRGDFIKVFGEVKKEVGDNGKTYTSVKVIKATLLKTVEQLRNNKEKENSHGNKFKET